MKTVTMSTLRSHLGDYLNQNEPVVVTHNGHPKAVLMPVADEDDLERLLMANNAELMKMLDEADRRISTTGGIPHDEFWARVDRETKAGKQADKGASKMHKNL
ncbi:type II toxin-antitoxin system Phd/YefM family antitoxin [Candidatus Poribacteria bacterium]|nr:type II toxin-antitoxin system Phd/YefM family antitoxin [Candidatus Poribacteria bacterium]